MADGEVFGAIGGVDILTTAGIHTHVEVKHGAELGGENRRGTERPGNRTGNAEAKDGELAAGVDLAAIEAEFEHEVDPTEDPVAQQAHVDADFAPHVAAEAPVGERELDAGTEEEGTEVEVETDAAGDLELAV